VKAELSGGVRRVRIAFKRNTYLQIVLLVAAWAAGEFLVSVTKIPVPGGVLAFFILVPCLCKRLISSTWLNRGASGLLDHLPLFFVPAMVALVGRPELVGSLGLKLLLIVVLGTVLVMGGTALVVEVGFRWRASLER
jgi:holin-like protein